MSFIRPAYTLPYMQIELEELRRELDVLRAEAASSLAGASSVRAELDVVRREATALREKAVRAKSCFAHVSMFIGVFSDGVGLVRQNLLMFIHVLHTADFTEVVTQAHFNLISNLISKVNIFVQAHFKSVYVLHCSFE